MCTTPTCIRKMAFRRPKSRSGISSVCRRCLKLCGINGNWPERANTFSWPWMVGGWLPTIYAKRFGCPHLKKRELSTALPYKLDTHFQRWWFLLVKMSAGSRTCWATPRYKWFSSGTMLGFRRPVRMYRLFWGTLRMRLPNLLQMPRASRLRNQTRTKGLPICYYWPIAGVKKGLRTQSNPLI